MGVARIEDTETTWSLGRREFLHGVLEKNLVAGIEAESRYRSTCAGYGWLAGAVYFGVALIKPRVMIDDGGLQEAEAPFLDRATYCSRALKGFVGYHIEGKLAKKEVCLVVDRAWIQRYFVMRLILFSKAISDKEKVSAIKALVGLHQAQH
jgi:hypothetical protein